MADRDRSYRGKLPLRTKRCLGVVVALLCVLGSAVGCSTKRNDGASRFYHNLTTRYNVYHNGQLAFNEGYKSLYQDLSESYTELLVPDPITRTAGAESSEETAVGGSLGKAIEKGQKAIREHSIRTKPKISREDLLRNPKKKAFYNKMEYNPFLHNAWMMVGESQFYGGHFMEALATFSYMTRLYSTEDRVRDEARIWQARCYLALGWVGEADEILNNLPEEGVYKSRSKIYPLAETELALKQGDTLSAISYLQQTIDRKPIKAQRARLYYLLGQLYSNEGRKSEASQAFGRVIRLAPPYPLEFAATMRRLEIEAQGNLQRVIQRLERLAHKDKNKELVDQIYLTQGRLYLAIPDTTHAVTAFTHGVEQSTQRSFDYMLCQLHLGDIYLAQNNYLKAQEAYAGAAGVIEKSHPRYEAVTKLSADLDQLVSFAQQVYEQDSLRRIAALPETERLAYADSLITAYKKAQEEARKQELLAEQQGQNEALNQQADINMPGGGRPGGLGTPPPMAGSGNGKSYFYNPTLVAQGKDLFERKWGKRPLADDWRRRNKQISFDASDPTAQMGETGEVPADSLSSVASPTDSLTSPTDSLSADQDPLQRAYYLSKLPTTPEQIAASDEIIQTALVGMGKAFNEQMEHFEEAIKSYEDLLRRYPEYADRASIYYTLYMLYQRLERADLAEPWRRKLLAELPEDPLAVTLQDPNYIAKLRANIGADERLYDQAFNAYLAGRSREVQRLYRETAESYPLSETLPQFAFVNALSYVLQGDEAAFRKGLESLTTSYPKEEVAVLAQEMLQRLLRGARIAQGGYQGIAWDLRLASQDSVAGTLAEQPFTIGKRSDKYQALLIVPQRGDALERSLRFAVESFNYAQFTDYILPVAFAPSEHETLLTISDLPSATVAWQYVTRAYSPEGYLSALDSSALLLVMTDDNYRQVATGAKSIGDYMTFVADSLVELYPAAHYLIDRWLLLTGSQAEKPVKTDTVASPALPAIDKPITFEIDRSQIALPAVELQLDSLLQKPEETMPVEDQRTTIQKARQVTPEDLKQMERERKAQERQAKREREEQLKERQRQRDAELKARREEQRRQEQLRQEQIKRVEAERRAQEKARKEQLRQQEKERQKRLKALEEERRRKLKEREAQQKEQQKQRR